MREMIRMAPRTRRRFLACLVCGAISSAVLCFLIRKNYAGAGFSEMWILCESLMITGMIFLSCWLIGIGWYEGFLDLFQYSAGLAFSLGHPEEEREKRDFVTFCRQKKMRRSMPTYLLLAGLCFFLPAFVLYIFIQ